jgi:thymidylate synthase ThyX
MEITAKIIADSVNPNGERITTFIVKYPYWIHGEVMTHRAFSRNFPSTRAIPIKTYVEKVKDEMSVPLVWTQNEKGMHTDKTMSEEIIPALENFWKSQGLSATEAALMLEEKGLHKQVANRLLMPFMMMEGIITATEFQNFFELRDHPFAEPHIQILAREMKKAYAESTPNQLQWGEWHIPFDTSAFIVDPAFPNEIQQIPSRLIPLEERLQKATAACARVSYANVDGSNSTLGGDLRIFNQLKDANPMHASPFEHCARAFDWWAEIGEALHSYHISVDGDGVNSSTEDIDKIYASQGNFRGFQQLRWFVSQDLSY